MGVIGYLGKDKKAIFSMGCIGHGVSLTTMNGRTIAESIIQSPKFQCLPAIFLEGLISGFMSTPCILKISLF